MPFSPPAYDGAQMFGIAVRVQHLLNPPAEQVNAFFGLAGTQALFGGSRGRVFEVQGVIFGGDISVLNDAESLILSYIDGFARTFEDTRGRAWPQTLMKMYRPADKVITDSRGNVWLPYKCALVGLL